MCELTLDALHSTHRFTIMSELIIKNFRFSVTRAPDADAGYPWDVEEGHGPVILASGNVVAASIPKGARELRNQAGHLVAHYDARAAERIAKVDNWSLPPEKLADWAKALGHLPTRGEVRKEAVRQDFWRMVCFVKGDWWYEDLTVQLLDKHGQPVPGFVNTLSVVESDIDQYDLTEMVNTLAEELISQLDGKTEVTIALM
jgi:hypothetical protein